MEQTFIAAVPTQYQEMLGHYLSIVEKTNQQTSLWFNPYGLAVGILTLLVAIGAIVVAWYLWKNSKEQRDLYFSTIESHKKQIEDHYKVLLEEKRAEVQKVVEDFEKVKDSVTDEKKSEFETLIKEYKKKIKNLEKQQSTVSSYQEPVKVFYDTIYSLSDSILSLHRQPEIHKMFCSSCKRAFDYSDDSKNPLSVDYISPTSLYGAGISNKKARCPYCRFVNTIK